jgi:hypothetical protein
MNKVQRDPDFTTPEDPLNDPKSLRVLLTCLMRRLGEKQHTFRQEDFDAVRHTAIQCEFSDEGLVVHIADSFEQLPGLK